MKRCRLALAGLLAGLVAGTGAGAKELDLAVLRDGTIQHWHAEAAAPGVAATPFDPATRTPLGSLWKLFVYLYLGERGIQPADYVCGGVARDEVYCCQPGGGIDAESALASSCGLYFAPERLALDAADWSAYWRGLDAPEWLTRLDAMRPETQVDVASLLRALGTVPDAARRRAGGALLANVLARRDNEVAQRFGGLLRVKTFSWHQPGQAEARLGGAAGWLADGSPVWLSGPGTGQTVLARAAALLPVDIPGVEDAAGDCVKVDLFSRYPLAALRDATGAPARPGLLDGRYQAIFENGNRLEFTARGETLYQPGPPARLEARLTVAEYVARVLDREAAARPEAAARALAIAARTYLYQEARRVGECLRIADSSATQRVSASPATAAARRVAAWTDSLILNGAQVNYHAEHAAPNRLSWRDAVAWAQDGASYDDILRRVWANASLISTDSPLATDCQHLADAERWLAGKADAWRARLAGEAGYEAPAAPTVCRVTRGNPYADTRRNRVYAHGLDNREARITLAHEYLHLAFAAHPRGQDEVFIERLARRLLLEDTP